VCASRRQLTLATLAGLSVLPSFSKSLRAQSASFDPVRSWGFGPPISDPVEAVQNQTGTRPPKFGEISKAFSLLYAAPRNQDPIVVAKYFHELKDKNEDGNLYNEEWPKEGRANPLVVGFFSSTFTIPSEGDETSWCAAFVNFCLLASGRPVTGSAQSGSFRNDVNYPAVDRPKIGDIVIFRRKGPEGDKGFGHVGFFLSEDGAAVEVLGGNQGMSLGRVSVAKFPFQGSSLDWFGFRKIG
jgi:uncharacterized protein (TIGR02594 family)